MVRVLSNVDARLHRLERQVPGRLRRAVLDAFCDGLTEAGHRYTVEDDAAAELTKRYAAGAGPSFIRCGRGAG